ncbi:MAG: LTA synthase family protein [Muribaculaceae bacterium]|nr:LTA synthase family protein [Muribaculaceae bacterium]
MSANIRPILRILAFFGVYLIIFIILKPIFMAVYLSVMGDISVIDWFRVIAHGLPMDCSMAGYLTIVPALLSLSSVWSSSRCIRIITNVYIALTAAIIAIVAVADLALYGYWNFRLDTTPFFYFFSSPSSALASVSSLIAVAGFLATAGLAVAIYFIIKKTAAALIVVPNHNIPATIFTLLLTAALIIPIRGSLTVSTMNLSRSYFSANQRLNHAAINPLFSLMYSATHQSDFGSQFRYFDNDDADHIFTGLSMPVETETDSVSPLFSTAHPDIYIIILESFSAHLMPSLGGEPIATGLDSIASTGLLFSNFYASGARTDRAIPAILSAFPAQPTTSLMKFAKKIEHTHSWPKALKELSDYDLSYYYGGDANFTNMLAYLVSSGFDNIVSDKDFPVHMRTSKWGAHDHVVFDRAWSDVMKDSSSAKPKFRVIQTSSSHEPFEVPYSDPRFSDSPRKNAFAYADRSLKNFVDSLSASPLWQKSIVVITPDHYGVYPEHLDNPLDRHHIPLVITGGALNREPEIITTVADQTAIATTLLSALGLDSSMFIYSRNILDPSAREYAFFSEPGMAAFVTPTDTVAINLDTDTPIIFSGASPSNAVDTCKAILQKIYTNLSEL